MTDSEDLRIRAGVARELAPKLSADDAAEAARTAAVFDRVAGLAQLFEEAADAEPLSWDAYGPPNPWARAGLVFKGDDGFGGTVDVTHCLAADDDTGDVALAKRRLAQILAATIVELLR